MLIISAVLVFIVNVFFEGAEGHARLVSSFQSHCTPFASVLDIDMNCQSYEKMVAFLVDSMMTLDTDLITEEHLLLASRALSKFDDKASVDKYIDFLWHLLQDDSGCTAKDVTDCAVKLLCGISRSGTSDQPETPSMRLMEKCTDNLKAHTAVHTTLFVLRRVLEAQEEEPRDALIQHLLKDQSVFDLSFNAANSTEACLEDMLEVIGFVNFLVGNQEESLLRLERTDALCRDV